MTVINELMPVQLCVVISESAKITVETRRLIFEELGANACLVREEW